MKKIFDWFKGHQTTGMPKGFIKIVHTKGGRTTREMLRPSWYKYGLGIWDFESRNPDEIINGIKRHDMVQQYLDTHPDAQTKYKSDQSGELNYYEVLKLAEIEAFK